MDVAADGGGLVMRITVAGSETLQTCTPIRRASKRTRMRVPASR
jgi:hypothetical protein